MSDWPIPVVEPLVTIHPYSLESIGSGLDSNGVAMNALTSNTWPATNRAIFVPFVLTKPIVVRRLFVFNGATVSGNVDVGIYGVALTRLVSSGSTAQSGTDALQYFDIADTTLGPGTFYLALAIDNTVATVNTAVSSAIRMRMLGVAEQESAFPLPATATLAAFSYTTCPMVGLTTRTV